MLAEIMIAIAIFSVGFLAAGSLVLSAARSNTNSHIRTQATLLAAQTLETLKNTPDISGLVISAAPYSDPNNPIDSYGDPGGIYTRSWTISDPVGHGTSRQVAVTVSWSRFGITRSVTLTTLTKGRGT
jgi:type IV pilus assembly protein PilV